MEPPRSPIPDPGPASVPSPRELDAGPSDAFPPGRLRRVVLGDVPVAVLRTPGGAVLALLDRCPHAGAPLSEGAYRDGHVVCSWHGWRFDPATGACPHSPAAPPAVAFPARESGGRVLVAVPERS